MTKTIQIGANDGPYNEKLCVPFLTGKYHIVIENTWFENYHKRSEDYTTSSIQIQCESDDDYALLMLFFKANNLNCWLKESGYIQVMSHPKASRIYNAHFRHVPSSITKQLFEKTDDKKLNVHTTDVFK